MAHQRHLVEPCCSLFADGSFYRSGPEGGRRDGGSRLLAPLPPPAAMKLDAEAEDSDGRLAASIIAPCLRAVAVEARASELSGICASEGEPVRALQNHRARSH